MPPKTVKETGLVKIDTFLKKIRDLCRDNNLNVWNKLSIPDLIYQDLLFIYHIPRLQREKILTLDLEFMMDGIVDKITEEMIENVSFSWYNALLSFKTDMDRSAVFKNLWLQLQVSEVKELFDGREFSMFPIEKDTKKSSYYYKLMNAIFEYMANITLESYESNAAYTYFKKGLNKGTAQTFGQFYTPESVIQSVVNEIKPLSTETVLDPSCGSCSFIQGTAKYIKDHENLDNSTTFRNLYGIEVERTIFTEGIMNIFINFGILPDMKKNIIEEDAYTELLTKDTQYDVIVANPPFGADASTFSEFYYKTIIETTETKTGKKRDKKIITINPEVKCKIEYPNTKESALLFWQIIVQKLKPGGRAGVVMSATLLNDGNSELIQWFLETCSLKKIIINPAGTFKDQGTSIETFSFIYTKGTPTTNVKIVMLGAEDVSVKELTLEQIREAGWKIKIKEDEAKKVYTGKFELIKLGDIAFTKKYPSYETSHGKESGLYKFHTGAESTKLYVDEPDIKDTVVIINKTNGTGKCSVFIDKNCSVAKQAVVMCCENEITTNYLYYWILSNKKIMEETYIGSCHKNISLDMAKNIKIPLPPISIQEQINTNLDRIFANPQDMKETLAFTDRAMDLMLQDPTGAQLEDLVESIRLRRHHQTSANSIKRQMTAVMRSVSARGFERKKLGDILYVFKTGKNQNNLPDGEYPFYMANGIAKCYATYQFDGEYILNGRCGSKLDDSCYYVNGKFSASDFTYVMQTNKDYMLNKYLYQYIKRVVDWNKYKTGTTMPNLPRGSIINLEIPTPPLPIQTEILAILNEMEAELKMLEQMATKAEIRSRYILDGYLSTSATKEVEEEEAEPPSTTLTHEPPSPTLSILPPIPLIKPDYKVMSKPELLEQCKKNNIKGVSNKKKEELIILLEAL